MKRSIGVSGPSSSASRISRSRRLRPERLSGSSSSRRRRRGWRARPAVVGAQGGEGGRVGVDRLAGGERGAQIAARRVQEVDTGDGPGRPARLSSSCASRSASKRSSSNQSTTSRCAGGRRASRRARRRTRGRSPHPPSRGGEVPGTNRGERVRAQAAGTDPRAGLRATPGPRPARRRRPRRPRARRVAVVTCRRAGHGATIGRPDGDAATRHRSCAAVRRSVAGGTEMSDFRPVAGSGPPAPRRSTLPSDARSPSRGRHRRPACSPRPRPPPGTRSCPSPKCGAGCSARATP